MQHDTEITTIALISIRECDIFLVSFFLVHSYAQLPSIPDMKVALQITLPFTLDEIAIRHKVLNFVEGIILSVHKISRYL